MNYAVYAILGIFTVFIFSASILASAETGAKSTAFEKTTLLEFTNNDSSPVHTIKLWLGKDVGTFKSFKAEKGWTGVKNSQGVLVFTSTEPLGSGESVKFGIKTEIESPGVNWKTSDSAGNESVSWQSHATTSRQDWTTRLLEKRNIQNNSGISKNRR